MTNMSNIDTLPAFSQVGFKPQEMDLFWSCWFSIWRKYHLPGHLKNVSSTDQPQKMGIRSTASVMMWRFGAMACVRFGSQRIGVLAGFVGGTVILGTRS